VAMISIELDVGKLYTGQFRRFLDKLKFLGENFEYMESKGWLSNRFVIKGEVECIMKIRESVYDFKRRLDSEV
jgi:hypothetical protein